MKLISKKFWQDTKNFVEQISLKMNSAQTVAVYSTPKYR